MQFYAVLFPTFFPKVSHAVTATSLRSAMLITHSANLSTTTRGIFNLSYPRIGVTTPLDRCIGDL